MPPDLLLYPVFDHREASMRIADSEVVQPTTDDRVDHLNYLPHGLTYVLSEDLPELCKQLRPLLQLRRVVRSCRLMGALVISPLASHVVGTVSNSRVPLLHRH